MIQQQTDRTRTFQNSLVQAKGVKALVANQALAGALDPRTIVGQLWHPEAERIRCVACGTMNRVPREKMEQGREAVCGHCKAPLFASSKPVIVTDATFSAQVERSPLPAIRVPPIGLDAS